MRITSVNVGKATMMDGVASPTGIIKVPCEHPVEVTPEGVTGDAVCNRRSHGGPDQAVYAYGGKDYAFWAQHFRELVPGSFGENLTIEHLASAEFNVGDRFHIGTTVLEVTAPRIPCATLAARMDDKQFPLMFRKAERPGLYFRVIEAGKIQPGDAVTVDPAAENAVGILEIFREHYNPAPRAETLHRFLAAPIDTRTRKGYEDQLRRMGEEGK